MIRTRSALGTLVLVVMAASFAGTAVADTTVIAAAQFAPLTESPRFKLFGMGDGIEWVPGEATEWIAGVDVPTHARLTRLIVYCLDNVETNAVVRLYRVRGDGSAAEEIEAVATGGTREEPGTGYMADDRLRVAKRVDRDTYHYFVRVTIPRQPDDVSGILRVTGVQVEWER